MATLASLRELQDVNDELTFRAEQEFYESLSPLIGTVVATPGAPAELELRDMPEPLVGTVLDDPTRSRSALSLPRSTGRGVDSQDYLEYHNTAYSSQGTGLELLRDLMLLVLPPLVEEFGESSAAAGAEWYESTTGNRAVMAPTVTSEEVTERVRYRAGHLWNSGGVRAAVSTLTQDLGEFVKRPNRHTLEFSAERNNQRFVRVPRGAYTCAFCLMMASRSAEWMYRSRRSAGDRGRGVGDDYHNDCDCAVVPADDPGDVPWDPEEYYRVYDVAADLAGSRTDTKLILQNIRREFPDAVTDPVFEDEE